MEGENKEEKVQASKVAYMENVVGFLTKCFGQDSPYPAVLEEYLAYVNDMDFFTDPDYDAIREMFEKCITGLRKSLTGKLVWNKPKPRGRQTKKLEVEDENSKASLEDGDEDSSTGDKVRRSRRIQEADKEEDEKEDKEEDTETSMPYWEAVLSKNPERIMRKKKPIELSLKEADFDKRQKEVIRMMMMLMIIIFMTFIESEQPHARDGADPQRDGHSGEAEGGDEGPGSAAGVQQAEDGLAEGAVAEPGGRGGGGRHPGHAGAQGPAGRADQDGGEVRVQIRHQGGKFDVEKHFVDIYTLRLRNPKFLKSLKRKKRWRKKRVISRRLPNQRLSRD